LKINVRIVLELHFQKQVGTLNISFTRWRDDTWIPKHWCGCLWLPT